jgi:Fic family protein
MYLEGTQTTMSDVLEDVINEDNEKKNEKIYREATNHTQALQYGARYLLENNFNHAFIKELHEIMLTGIVPENKIQTLGKYKECDNHIINSAGTVVFNPPPFTETKKYMDELIDFMNDTNIDINPLIKTAIIHSQFESIHPFDDGNGRVGRLLISLCLYKFGVIKFPFFYISEAISQNKIIYYNKLTDSRKSDYTEWIKYFLNMCTLQSEKHTKYIDALNRLYDQTSQKIKKIINTQKYEEIIRCIFTQPIISSSYLVKTINISPSQARKYLVALEDARILSGDDRIRNRKFYFLELLTLINKN